MGPLLVELVDVGGGLLEERADLLAVAGGVEQLVLRVRDLALDRARREALGVDVELLDAALDEADRVLLVVDREAARVAEPLRVGAEHARAGGVEGHHPHRPRAVAHQHLHPLAHLLRGLVGEGDRQDLARPRAPAVDEVRDPVRQHAGLARAGAGEDQQRTLAVQDGLALGLVEPLQKVVCVRSRRHPARIDTRYDDPRAREGALCGVAASARHVSIDLDAAGRIEPGPPPVLDPERHYLEGSREDVAMYMLTLDAINFGSGWFPTLRKRPGHVRLLHGCVGPGRAVPRGRAVVGGGAAAARRSDLAAVFGQDRGHPLIALFADALRSLGEFLDDRDALRRSSRAPTGPPAARRGARRRACPSSTTSASGSGRRSCRTTWRSRAWRSSTTSTR